MRPRLQRHPALRHRPEHLSDRLLGGTKLLLNDHLPAFIQHAIPAPAIPKIQSHREFLLRKDSGLFACHSDTLRHSRSPFIAPRARCHWELIASRLEAGILIPSDFDNHDFDNHLGTGTICEYTSSRGEEPLFETADNPNLIRRVATG